VLYFVSKELALGYLLFSFLSALGVLQCVAVRYRLVGLSLLNGRPRGPLLQRRTWGYGLGILLIAGSTVWFFASQWTGILAPGPAGAELSLLFGAGAACAPLVSLVMPWLWQSYHKARSYRTSLQSRDAEGRAVAVSHATGHLYIPPNPVALMPAICLVPMLGAGEKSMDILARRMAHEGLVALIIHPDEESYSYPAILAILPAAISLLSKHPEVDPQRLGALGYDLGGDLVIRAASAAKQIKAVATLAPVLVDAPVGLDLLREMSYFPAWRWTRDRKRAKLRTELNALAYGTKIAPRPLLLLYGAEDRLVNNAPIEKWDAQHKDSVRLQVIQGAGHLDLVDHPMALHAIVQWFKEHL